MQKEIKVGEALYWTFYNKQEDKRVNDQTIISLQQTQDVFRAFVDAMVPRTPRLAEEYDEIQFFGALDFETDEYIIMSLNNYYIPLASPTAELLDEAAQRFVLIDGEERLLKFSRYLGGGVFVSLSPSNRLCILALLDEVGIYLADLPIPFQEQPELIQSILSALNRLTMMGYYSEWFGYGSTRLKAPDQRKLEFSPLSWTQVGYPGPAFSYRAEVMDYYKRRKNYE